MTQPSFSLITQPWIRCESTGCTTVDLSLREVFDGTAPVRGLRGDSPTQDYAVLRTLMAIHLRAHRSALGLRPSDSFDFQQWCDDMWEQLETNYPDFAVLDYLERFSNRFDLLHPVQPFMQVAELRTPKEITFPVSRIIPEAESSYFTMRAGDGLSSISFAEAARWLIHAQAFDYSGIKSGAVGDPRVKGGKGYPIGTGWSGMTGGTTILGRTLRHSLILNSTNTGLLGSDHDLPAWEREPDGPAQRISSRPNGATDIMTWQSRRVRLFHDGQRVTDVLVSNGDQIADAGANIFDDPMTPYRYSRNKSSKQSSIFYPRPYDANRITWRSLEPLISLEGDFAQAGALTLQKGDAAPKRPQTLDQIATVHNDPYLADKRVVNIRLTSMEYGPQASSYGTMVDARIDVPAGLLHEENLNARLGVLTAARATLDAAADVGKFAGSLLQAAGGDYAYQSKAADSLLSELEPAFRNWLRHLAPEAIDAEAERWQHHVLTTAARTAATLLRGAGPKAMIGREIEHNGRVSIVSAGTAYSMLQKNLRKHLPLTASEKEGESSSPAVEGGHEKKESIDVR